MLGRFEAFGNPMPASKQIFTKKYFRHFRCTTEIAAFDTDIEWHIGFFEKNHKVLGIIDIAEISLFIYQKHRR